MKLIIAGCRDFDDYKMLEAYMDHLLQRVKQRGEPIEIVSGRSNGADVLGERYAKTRGYPIKVFPAEWEKYGKRAGPLRNKQMADYGDALAAFWDGVSPGTKNMIACAKKRGLPIRIKRLNKR